MHLGYEKILKLFKVYVFAKKNLTLSVYHNVKLKKNKVRKNSRDLSFNEAKRFFEPKYLSQKGTYDPFFLQKPNVELLEYI